MRDKPAARIARISDGRRQIVITRDFVTTTLTLREREFAALFAEIEAEATARERQRCIDVVRYHLDAHNGNECLLADLLDGEATT